MITIPESPIYTPGTESEDDGKAHANEELPSAMDIGNEIKMLNKPVETLFTKYIKNKSDKNHFFRSNVQCLGK